MCWVNLSFLLHAHIFSMSWWIFCHNNNYFRNDCTVAVFLVFFFFFIYLSTLNLHSVLQINECLHRRRKTTLNVRRNTIKTVHTKCFIHYRYMFLVRVLSRFSSQRFLISCYSHRRRGRSMKRGRWTRTGGLTRAEVLSVNGSGALKLFTLWPNASSTTTTNPFTCTILGKERTICTAIHN